LEGCGQAGEVVKLEDAIEKENKRVTYEWEVLMEKYGKSYDEMTNEGKKAACDLADKQGERSSNMWKTIERL
jgi:hypothetical protein